MRFFPRVCLDTNVFIALVEDEDETRASLLSELICRQPLDKAPIFCTSEISLAETLVKPLRLQREAVIQRYEDTIQTSYWLDVVPVARDVLYYAAVIRSQFKLKLPDAIHLSTAYAAGCTHFLTRDTDFQDTYSLRHTRHGATSPSLSLSVLRLDIPVLETLIKSFTS
jgi:predicted nucleic acid-binding protein